MAVKRTEREIPQAWRDAVARSVEAWIARQPLTSAGKPPSERALAGTLGISQFSLNKLRNKSGPFGLHILVALTGPLEMTLDELLGMPPTQVAIRRIVDAALAAHDAALAASATKRQGR